MTSETGLEDRGLMQIVETTTKHEAQLKVSTLTRPLISTLVTEAFIHVASPFFGVQPIQSPPVTARPDHPSAAGAGSACPSS